MSNKPDLDFIRIIRAATGCSYEKGLALANKVKELIASGGKSSLLATEHATQDNVNKDTAAQQTTFPNDMIIAHNGQFFILPFNPNSTVTTGIPGTIFQLVPKHGVFVLHERDDCKSWI